jgi:gamma-glutamyltranspeptidase/glutathione hydrolase
VVPPGTGVVLNNSMSNFAYTEPGGINYAAAGKRPRSTIAPTLVFRGHRPVLAIGIPGSVRIPTAMLQVLLDRLALDRPLADAIGDTRFHFYDNWRQPDGESFQVEQSLPSAEAEKLRRLGWKVDLVEPSGTGRMFGGINAIEFNADGRYTGYADPRRTNAAVGY